MSSSAIGSKEMPKGVFQQVLKGHNNLVRGVILLPGGPWIITASEDGSLRLWDLKSGLQIGKAWQDGESAVFTIALSPDGKTVASGSADGAVRLWNANTGKVVAKWTGHNDIVWSICWRQDGHRVVSGSEDGTTRMWDAESGKTTLGPIDTGHKVVYAVSYSPDESMIATGGYDSLIKIWDSKTFKLVATLEGHTMDVYCLAWIANGKRLISGSIDHSIRVWNTTTWKQFGVLTEHRDAVRGVSTSPNGRILASASFDKTVRLWDLQTGQPIALPIQHADEVYCVSFSSDGGLLSTGCIDNNVYIWNVSAIVKDAGFDALLVNCKTLQDSIKKPVLNADTTRHVSEPSNSGRNLPTGFFDTGDRVSSSTPPFSRSFAGKSPTSRTYALRRRYSSLFRRSSPVVRDVPSHVIPTSSRPFHSALFHFPRRRRSDNEQQPPEVEVPYTRGQARNIKATGKSRKRVPAPSNLMTLNVPGTSKAPNSTAAGGYRSDKKALPQERPATDITAATTSVPLDHEFPSDTVMIRQVGCWTRFWLCIC